MGETIGIKELAKLLLCSARTIQRRLEKIAERPDLLPPGKLVGGKWIWLKSVVFEWLSPHQPARMQAGSLSELATHQLIHNKQG